ncbi:MAG: ribulose-phosphate 3-epimerase, partial [Eubacteriales bacterium]|nr:ribulose-phosphate 3-epimerase [Eubacteriales bacterium]
RLGEAARRVRDAGCDELHLDIMDGVFVPNLSFGPAVLKDLRRVVDLPMDTHLMIIDPLKYIDVFADAGATSLTVHVEAEHFEESIRRIRERGLRVGASLKPGTPADALRPYVKQLDLVLLMTVEPGFGGQKLKPEALGKAAELRAMGFEGVIEADGGIGPENAALLAQAGVDLLVMGTAFFRSENPKALCDEVHALHA